MLSNKIKIVVLFILYCIGKTCFAANLDTQLSRDQITLGDSVVVTYILSNSVTKVSPDFSALQKDFNITHTDYSNAISIINGITTTQTTWRLLLEPKKAGKLIIPEINFGNDKSAALKLTVTGAQPNSTNTVNGKQNPLVFVSGEISSTTPYVQSQVLYTFKLYFRTSIIRPNIEFKPIKDVTFLPLSDGQQYQTTVNGKLFDVVEKKFAIFPQRTGTLNIAPVQLHALTSNDDPFNLAAPKAVLATTKDFTLTVDDVPSNYQGTTWLPAKELSLTEQWSENSKNWDAGTPVTRTITIRAQGLRADQLPDISIEKPKGVNVYIDRPKRDNLIQNNTVVGVLEQKITYIPTTTPSFTIPPLKINWWNTQTNKNAVSQLNEMVVQVQGIAAAVKPPVKTLPQSSPVMNSLPINTQKIVNATPKFYKSIWFWITCALLTTWIVTLFSLLRKKPVSAVKTQAPIPSSVEINDKEFAQSCQLGNAMQAQQYLFTWAKERWPDMPINLATLRELSSDAEFKQALEELEQSLYGKNAMKWNGTKLLAAFLKIKKFRNNFSDTDANRSKDLSSKLDPLPPLNPVFWE